MYSDRESETISKMVLEEVTQCSYSQLLMTPNKKLNPGQMDQLSKIMKRLTKGEPIQYILGKAHFYGREFLVGQGVLIPRGETEELVNWMINDLNKKNEIKILEIGTGSGSTVSRWKIKIADWATR